MIVRTLEYLAKDVAKTVGQSLTLLVGLIHYIGGFGEVAAEAGDRRDKLHHRWDQLSLDVGFEFLFVAASPG